MQPDPRPPDTGPERPYAPRAFGTGQDPASPSGSFLPPEPDLPPREEPQDGRDQEGGQTRSRLPRIVAYVLIVLGVFFFLRYQVFSISNIRIIGIRNVSRETVIRAAGLDRGLFYFLVNEEAVRNGVNANRYLIYEGMETVFPNAMVLRVSERTPLAFFSHLGIGYVISRDGMVLEQTRDLSSGQGLIAVSGLALWGQISPGSFPSSTDPSQAEGLISLLSELTAWGFGTQVRSVDVAHSLNLSILTFDGHTVNLGSAEQLHAKIGTVQAVVSELRRRQMPPGIIEAAEPGEATYRPLTP